MKSGAINDFHKSIKEAINKNCDLSNVPVLNLH